MSNVLLTTEAGEKLRGTPWDVCPRPQLRRENYVNLNGAWEFAVTDSDDIPERFDRTITVPFPPESALSGIGEHFPEGSRLWYRTRFTLDNSGSGRVLLHLDGIDQTGFLLLNGHRLPEQGTLCTAVHGPETADITDYVNQNNELLLCVTDDLRRKEYPYGKQTLKRGGMWYTPFSGVWKTVWLERVPREYIRSLKITPSLTGALLELDGPGQGVVLCEGREYPFSGGCVNVTPEQPELWTPEHPKLYDVTIRAGEDEVRSYFALRTLETKNVNGIPRLCLNGKPFFFHGLLDQGYWPDGICTPASPQCYEDDILAMKRLGFNTLRKHIKIESEQFYYDCDRLGMLVFQDTVNNGRYRFFRDTVLPTAGIQKLPDRLLNRNKTARRMFREAAEATVRGLYNHPCICYWTVFNEGWGQHCGAEYYARFKTLDGTRFTDTTSGWFRAKHTDVESRHVYFRKFRLPRSEKPVVLSEFGGYVYKLPAHSFNPDKTYGYRFYKTEEEYRTALEALYENEILPAVPKGLCGAVYTQVSDVEDETNGLLTYDRKICKPDGERMRALAEKLRAAIEEV